MNESRKQFFFNRALFFARVSCNRDFVASRQMRAGKICRSCKSALPLPHAQGPKLCSFCANKHIVYMYFRYWSKWYCAFRTEARRKLPKEFTFANAGAVREMVKRGNGLIDRWDRDDFELGLELGRGGVWLRLTDDQYRALGGVVSKTQS